jgi:hypothetical protein
MPLKMHPDKAEFKRLIELLGWSQTEAARRLHKTPSAINHLVNPGHPNKPTKTMMELLKLIMARDSPGLVNDQTCELKKAGAGAKPDATRLSPRERKIMDGLKQLPAVEQERVYAVIEALIGMGVRVDRNPQLTGAVATVKESLPIA